MAPSSPPLPRFAELLATRIVVFDGAMGTMLYSAGISFGECFDGLNLGRPELVRDVHAAYVAAGAHVIETNTFGANRYRLAEHHLADRLAEINATGVRLAREAGGEQALVAGSIGPLGKHLAPIGNLPEEDAVAAFREQGEALAGAGADLLVVETITNLEEMLAAVRGLRPLGLPLVTLLTFGEEGKTLVGNKPQEVARILSDEGVSALGANCSVGPQGILEVLEKMIPHTRVPVVVMPNAGLPRLVSGRYLYLSSPEYFADFGRRAVELGVAGVGGCCGTTPDHVRALAREVAERTPSPPGVPPRIEVVEPAPAPRALPRTGDANRFFSLLGLRFPISVEIDPPRGVNVERYVKSAIYLKSKGADAINVADSPLARPRMSPSAFCHIIQRDAGIETLLHVSCRDRNLLATQSELMGAHALGIRNIIAVTGDPVQVGGYLQAKDVFDLDSVSLTRLIRNLNQGKDLTESATDEPTQFRICVAANPTAVDLDAEIAKLHRKLEAGAEFIFTQPVFDPADLERFLGRVPGLPVPLCVGVLPLRSVRHADFLHNEVPGMVIPRQIRERMRRAGEGAGQEGLAIAVQLLRVLRPLCQGAYVMPPFNRFEMAGEILDAFTDR